jgi:hypothetical protein
MNRRNLLFSGMMAFAFAFAAAAQTESSKLTAQISYTGSGTVDDSHKVYVVLWDTPDFMKDDASGIMPIDVKAITSKSAAAQFDDVKKNPVYVSMVYDPSGKWEATSAPPAGSSLGLYQRDPGSPAPIRLQPGKTNQISATFDDSYKMK